MVAPRHQILEHYKRPQNFGRLDELLEFEVVRSVSLGATADWKDEGEPGDPSQAAAI